MAQLTRGIDDARFSDTGQLLWIYVVDADYRAIEQARVRAWTTTQRLVSLKRDGDHFVGRVREGEEVCIESEAEGYAPDTHQVRIRGKVTQVVHGLPKPGQLLYTHGNDRLAFEPREDAYLVDVVGEKARPAFQAAAKKLELEWEELPAQFPDARSNRRRQDSVFATVKGPLETSHSLVGALRSDKLRVAAAALIQHGDRPALGLTAEIVVRFRPELRRKEVERVAASVGFGVARTIAHLGNGFLLVGPEGAQYDVLEAVETLRRNPAVIYAEPNLLFQIELDQYTPNDPLFSQVPHLPLINADDAWDRLDDVTTSLRGGSPTVTVGVADPQGVAPDHPDLTATLTNGAGKLVISVDFFANPIVTQTVAGLRGDHGTQCATSAVAAFDDSRGLPGVAPNCRLIGAQIRDRTDAVRMSDLYLWMAGFDNGSSDAGFPALPAQPADVITSSFGSTGLALSNAMRDCFDFLTSYGRNGRGCIVCFSLGNSGYRDFTNPTGTAFRSWPTYEKTLGVGSSINTNPTNPATSVQPDPNGATTNIATAVDTRALFSPFGAAALIKPDLVSPSHTSYASADSSLVDPILAGVRVGTGNVDGCAGPATCNDYDTTFGGTSHSTPTVAGACALIISAKNALTWVQVRDVLRESCVRIDAAQANAVGQWQDLDGDTVIDYSRWYGFGRLDVEAAIDLALDGARPLGDAHVRENLADIGDLPSNSPWWASPDIWVRQDATTPVPALAWNVNPPHQNAKRGQDNAVFCRVRNRGAADISVVYVRALLTHFAGLEFVFPDDFEPSTNVGAPLPSPLVPGTYLIGEARVDDLAPAADEIVKFVWPASLVPPETVVVSGATVRWHPCLLLDASPHDGPAALGGLAVPVQGNNNIAQRNIAIDNADADSDIFIGMIAGTRLDVGVATLIVDAASLRGNAVIRLHLADDDAMVRFIPEAVNVVRPPIGAVPGIPAPRPGCDVIVETRSRVRVDCGDCDVVMELAPGSRVVNSCKDVGDAARPSIVEAVHQGLPAVEIRNLRGRVEIPMRIEGGRFVPLLAAIVGDATGDLLITQRRSDGQIAAGYGIRRE